MLIGEIAGGLTHIFNAYLTTSSSCGHREVDVMDSIFTPPLSYRKVRGESVVYARSRWRPRVNVGKLSSDAY
jgi:hypothetical protein